MRSTITANFLAGFCAGCLATLASAQQGPDVLIPSGSLDGAYALVDKNKDGTYTATTGECWDYIKAHVNTSPRNYVLLDKKIYFSETGRDQIVWVQDTNGDGLIDEATERHVFYDVSAGIGGSGNVEPGFITLGYDNWIYWVNDGGTGEGIYRSKDLNNDGDAEDAGETLAVLTETMPQVNIENTPLTTAYLNGTVRTLNATELDSIVYDPTYGTYGRYLVEEEWSDQVVAFEDKNNDGDFSDKGECYLFCGLYPGAAVNTPRTTVIDHDANPDVQSGKLPISNEVIHFAIDASTKPATYYMMSGDTTATQLDAAIIFRAQDKNNDGDVNDAGETTIFWDGSLDSTGSTKAYNFCVGLNENALGGVLYVNVEWDGATDHEQLLRIQDLNNDGDANDDGETTVLWDHPADRTHYVPGIFPSGTLSPLKVMTTRTEIAYYGSASCQTSLNTTTNPSPNYHNIAYGISDATHGDGSSSSPHIGNSRWVVRTWGANASSLGAYGIGITKFPSGVKIGLGSCHVYNSLDVIAGYFTTDSEGIDVQTVPVPNKAALLGLWTYWQSIVVDATATNGLGLTFSDGFETKIGDWTYTDY